MGTIASSENPDEMAHNVAVYQGLHCLQDKKEMQYFLELITCNPFVYEP